MELKSIKIGLFIVVFFLLCPITYASPINNQAGIQPNVVPNISLTIIDPNGLPASETAIWVLRGFNPNSPIMVTSASTDTNGQAGLSLENGDFTLIISRNSFDPTFLMIYKLTVNGVASLTIDARQETYPVNCQVINILSNRPLHFGIFEVRVVQIPVINWQLEYGFTDQGQATLNLEKNYLYGLCYNDDNYLLFKKNIAISGPMTVRFDASYVGYIKPHIIQPSSTSLTFDSASFVIDSKGLPYAGGIASSTIAISVGSYDGAISDYVLSKIVGNYKYQYTFEYELSKFTVTLNKITQIYWGGNLKEVVTTDKNKYETSDNIKVNYGFVDAYKNKCYWETMITFENVGGNWVNPTWLMGTVNFGVYDSQNNLVQSTSTTTGYLSGTITFNPILNKGTYTVKVSFDTMDYQGIIVASKTITVSACVYTH